MTALLLPGDVIATSSSTHLNLGPGISASTSRSTNQPALIAIKPGFAITQTEKGKGKVKVEEMEGVEGDEAVRGVEGVHVQSSSKRYIPTPKDTVLGTIINRHAEGYRVDLGSAQMASLDALAFEGATKRSKPNLKVGTLIYARVTISSRDMEPELECFDPATGKSDGFGELKGGYMVVVSLQLARSLYDPRSTILSNLASVIPFEISIGLNGRIWVKSGSIGETIALVRVLQGLDEGTVRGDKAGVEGAARGFLA